MLDLAYFFMKNPTTKIVIFSIYEEYFLYDYFLM